MYGKCDACGAHTLTYDPQPHQLEFHKDTHQIRGLFGGYGSGKSVSAMAEIVDHCLSTPNGVVLVTAPNMRQLEKTAMKEFFNQMPDELITDFNKSKSIAKLYNGCEVLFFPSDDDQKIRSLNLTAFLMEEASGIKYQIFVELQNRLRNTNALDYKLDSDGNISLDKDGQPIILRNRLIGIVCSNPDVNWIRTEFLLQSSALYGDNTEQYYIEKPNPYYSSHIIASHKNKYLPKDFIARNSVNKPDWWIQRYLFGSFDYSDGMVYPSFIKHVVDPFEIPRNWKRLASADFGIRDPTVLLMGAVDPFTGIVYIYDEYYETDQPVNENAKGMNLLLDQVPKGLFLHQPVADPSGQKRDMTNLKSLYDHYAEYGIYFQAGNNKIVAGISKVYTYFSMGKVKIFSRCVNTIREGVAYKYKTPELANEKNLGETPIDKDNHAMDCLRYMIQLLPDDPDKLQLQAYGSWDVVEKNREFNFPEALRDDRNSYDDSDWYYV